jgi:hypothetical protein
MRKRLQALGAVLALIGLAFLVGAGVAYAKVQDGYDSLRALSAAQNVELTYNEDGELFEARTYEFEVDGRYWTDFDREHPIEGLAREQAWTGTAHGLIGELGVGTVTHSALQLGLGVAALLAGLGATFILLGAGLRVGQQDQAGPQGRPGHREHPGRGQGLTPNRRAPRTTCRSGELVRLSCRSAPPTCAAPM